MDLKWPVIIAASGAGLYFLLRSKDSHAAAAPIPTPTPKKPRPKKSKPKKPGKPAQLTDLLPTKPMSIVEKTKAITRYMRREATINKCPPMSGLKVVLTTDPKSGHLKWVVTYKVLCNGNWKAHTYTVYAKDQEAGFKRGTDGLVRFQRAYHGQYSHNWCKWC